MASDSFCLPGSPRIPLEINRSRRARRIRIDLHPVRDTVRLTIPTGVALQDAMRFVQSREAWIRGIWNGWPETIVPEVGGTVLYLGKKTRILRGDGAGVRLADDVLEVSTSVEQVPVAVGAFIRENAEARLVSEARACASRLGRSVGKITLRDPRSGFGSCTASGNLMFSWRVGMAPVFVQRYLAVHEACHLAEMRHNRKFWSLVESNCPETAEAKRWLRDNGVLLFRHRFEPVPV